MIDDYIVFLSGTIPHGIAILSAVLTLFAAVWLFVWKGTNFWSVRHYWKILSRVYFIVIVAYVTYWLKNRPPPIPTRIIVVNSVAAETLSDSWQVVAARETIQRLLYYSKENYVLLSGNESAALSNTDATPESIEYFAAQMNVLWVIYVEGGSSDKGITVFVKKHTSNGYKSKKEITYEISNFKSVVQLSEIVAGVIGHKEVSAAHAFLSLPDTSLSKYYKAINKLQQGEPDSAFRSLKELVEYYPDSYELRRDLAKCRMASRPEFYRGEIKWHLTEALRLNPDDPEVLHMLGSIMLKYRQWEEAESALKLSYSINKDDPRIYLLLSRLAKKRIEELGYKSNEELIARAIYLAPGYEAARLALSQLKVSQLRKRKALNILNEGLEVDSTSQSILLSKTAVLIELNEHPEAIETCKQILIHNPKHGGALYNLGIVHLWRREFDRALTMFDSSLHNGGTVDNYYYKGVTYQEMGEWELAIKEFQRRYANPIGAEDRAAISARERIKNLRLWIAQRDTVGQPDSLNQAG